MSKKLNYEKPKYASYEPKVVAAKRFKRSANQPATEKQIEFMKRLGIEFPKKITKFQAIDLISRSLKPRPRSL